MDVLKWGADEDADGMPPVCVFSENHKTATLEPDALEAIVRKESKEGLYSKPKDHPLFVPFP